MASESTESKLRSKFGNCGTEWSTLTAALEKREATLDLTEVLRVILDVLQANAPECAAGIFLIDDETRTIQGQITDNFDRDMNVGQGTLTQALRSSEPYVISDLAAQQRSGPHPEQARCQMVAPFQLSGPIHGALILRSRNPEAYSLDDGGQLASFAEAASTRIENAILRQKMAQAAEEDVERDLVMAKEIMVRLLPRKPPQIPNYDVASVYVPAKLVGGDLMDFISLQDDHFGFLVADAAGKGIPAALLMTGFRALFRGLIKNDFNIRSVFRKANTQLLDGTASHQFVSAFYAALDVETNRLIYVNGGHVHPLLYRPQHPVRSLDIGGPVLGVVPGVSYHEDSVVLHPQDILLCFSDGLSELENDQGEAFNSQRMLRVIEKHQREPAEAICAALQREATAFAGHGFRDDLSICVIKSL